MELKLVCFEVHLRLEDDKLLVQALLVGANEVVFSKMSFQRIIVYIILLFPPVVPSIADMALFMLVSAVGVQFVGAVEPLSTETTLGVSFEATLVNSTRVIITEFLVFSKLLYCKQLMFVREDLLVPCAEIT